MNYEPTISIPVFQIQRGQMVLDDITNDLYVCLGYNENNELFWKKIAYVVEEV